MYPVKIQLWAQEIDQFAGISVESSVWGDVWYFDFHVNIAFILLILRIPKKNGWAKIRNVTDVIALNQHQFLNCFSNIYVRRESDAGFVQDSFNQIERQRLAETHRVHHAILDEAKNMGKRYRVVGEINAEDQREAIVHTQTLHPKPTRWPSCLKWQSNPYAYYNGTGVGYVRNPDNGSLRSSDFDRVKVSI